MKIKAGFVLLGLMMSLASCDTEPTEIEVEIFGQGAGFEGFYSADGSKDDVSFGSSSTTTDVHKYQLFIDLEDSISIDVFPDATSDDDDGDETNMTSLTCRISTEEGTSLYEKTYSIESTAMKSFAFQLE